jgi:hypothetical protein
VYDNPFQSSEGNCLKAVLLTRALLSQHTYKIEQVEKESGVLT